MNSSNLRKILLFINITLIILIIGILGFAYFKNKSKKIITDSNDKTKKEKVMKEGPKLLADMAVQGLNIEEFSGKIKFYGVQDGALYEVSPNQEPKNIANANLKDIKKITWSPDNLKVFINAGQKKYIYDIIEQKSYLLNDNIQNSLVFSPNSQKILYNFKSPKENIISLADITGQNYSKVISSPVYEPKLAWTLTGVYLWSSSGDKNFSESLYLIDTASKKVAKIFDSISGLDVLPSLSGLKFIYQEYLEDDLILYLYDLSNKNVLKLPFSTLATKCVFTQSEEEIFCALTDKIIHYNIKLKLENEVAKISQDAIKLQLTPDEKYLIFQDLNSQKPYYLKIK